ncbi:MAG TPA: methyl-accepting chemotaxis protein [Pirellulaceae bacterium]|nr:methyl-accepting chemotaxis protein [Pirellulaceae bacterium]
MSKLSFFKFKSIKVKLLMWFLILGVTPAAIAAYSGYARSRGTLEELTKRRAELISQELMDKVDATMSERYGDVRLFASLKIGHAETPELIKYMNNFAKLYGVYDLMIVADTEGKIIAVNSADPDGKPINTQALIGTSVKGEPWFEPVAQGKVAVGEALCLDVARLDRVKNHTSADGDCVTFSAPIVDEQGKVVRVWGNFCSFDRSVAQVLEAAKKDNLERGFTLDLNVLSNKGLVLYDEDEASELQLNLAERGLLAAKMIVDNKNGSIVEKNARTGEPQVGGVACSEKSGDFAGLGWGVLVRQDMKEAYAACTSLAWFSGLVMLITSGVVGCIAWWIASNIAKPLVKAAAAIEKVAEGDLTQTVEVTTEDEIGQLSRAVNKLSSGLRDIIRNILQGTQTLTASSTQLNATADEMTVNANGTTQQSATVAAAAEEMAVNMRTMAGSTEEMSTNVKTVASAIEEMTASISEIAKNAESSSCVAGQAANLADVSNQKVTLLGEAANEIGKVIDVIQDIADQTNLLALNATIEAARAGEAGKGFAVVATEVKELAKQSAAATDNIRQRIQSMQGSTADTVKAIAEISSAIRNVNDVSRSIAAAVEEQSIATKEISRNVAQTATAASTVSRGVTESASACQEITRTIATVDQAAKSTAAGATQTKASGSQLFALAGKLNGLVSEFRV